MNLTKRNITNWLLGLIILSMGISFAIISEKGLTSYDASWTNLSLLLNISVGTASLIFASVFLVVILIIDFKIVYLFCVLSNIIIGYTVEFFMKFIFSNVEIYNLGWFYFFFAVLLICLGVTFFIKSNLPPSVPEQFMLTLVKVFKTDNLKLVKVGVDFFFLITALLFSLLAGEGLGYVSFGTLILALAMGPIIGFYSNLYDSLFMSKKQVTRF
ncbi:DUF6198 family protein [Mycoplasmatota bacterium zrk1]